MGDPANTGTDAVAEAGTESGTRTEAGTRTGTGTAGGAATHDDPFVLRDDADGVVTLTLNRPRARNPLSSGMLAELDSDLADLAADRSVRVVVIGALGPAFSAGHDLRELHASDDPAFHRHVFETCSTVMMRIATMPQPVVAAVGGIATAAGCQLVATCDLAIASVSARFATPGVDIGLFCSTPAVAVSRALLPKHTMQMLLTGEAVDAHTALRMGLVNEVVDDADLDGAVDRLGTLLASKPHSVLAAGKAALRAQLGRSLADAYGVATTAMVDGLAEPAATEGIGAFLDKRSPVWPDDAG